METTGEYEKLYEQMNATVHEREEVISDLEARLDHGVAEVKALERWIASVNKIAEPDEYGGTKEKRRREVEILKHKVRERNEGFDMGGKVSDMAALILDQTSQISAPHAPEDDIGGALSTSAAFTFFSNYS